MEKLKIGEKLDKLWLYSLLAEGYNTYYIISNYKLDEDLILECHEDLDKEIIIQGVDLSEDFINRSIEIGFLNNNDIKNLNMMTYSNLSEEFIKKYKKNINWGRMMLYMLLCKDHDDNLFTKYIDIIVKENLWDIISASEDLPIEFIKVWKDKLNWNILSLVKNFTEDEQLQFDDYIIKKKEIEIEEDYNISIDEIEEIINKKLTGVSLGEKVIKNESNWLPNELDNWGRGVGIGFIDSYPDNKGKVYVKWENGRSLESMDQIVKIL
jgi:hypothetical protein